MERIRPLGEITSLQPPYSLVRPETEKELLPYCEQHNIGVIAYSPMASGLLTGKMTKERVEQMPEDDFRKRSPRFQGGALERNLKLAALLGEIGKPHGRSAGEVAIAWTLRKPAVTAAIVGARNAKQVEGVIGAATFRLNESEVKRLEEFLRENPA
jgi:aryl-alcohol dehydrogenase-like predicted oxidoreductase